MEKKTTSGYGIKSSRGGLDHRQETCFSRLVIFRLRADSRWSLGSSFFQSFPFSFYLQFQIDYKFFPKSAQFSIDVIRPTFLDSLFLRKPNVH